MFSRSIRNSFSCVRHFGTAQAKLQPQNFIQPPVSIGQTKLLIDGKFVDSVTGKTFTTFDPRTEKPIANISEASDEDVEMAIRSARKAFDEGPWPRMAADERAKIMFKVADLVEQQMENLVAMETWDNGKPLMQARMDIDFVAKLFRYYGGYCDKIEGRTLRCPQHLVGHIDYEPYGVCGIITPWNFPLQQVAVKLTPALACGNTAVIKPAETAPLTTIALGQILLDAGVPEGTVNILQGFGETTGAKIVSSPLVDKLSFTGEAATGKAIMAEAAKNLTPVTLELGGKSPMIVFDDANMDGALFASYIGNFFNGGQVCCATTRVYVQERIYEEFVEKMVEKTANRKVGDPFDETVEQGPQQNPEVFAKVLSYLEAGKGESTPLVGGNRIGDSGYFVEPTIFEVEDDHKVSREEVFGPCMSIAKFSDDDEVLRRANDTNYGLAASVFSTNTNRLIKSQRTLKAGTVWLNTYGEVTVSGPFGGFKDSGMGRDLGYDAIKAFTQPKTVLQNVGNNTGTYL